MTPRSRSGLTSFINSSFRKNDDVLHLIKKRKWKRLRQLLNCTTGLSDSHSPLSEIENGQNLLHLLCSKEPPTDIVEKVIKASPLSPIEVDGREQTPLHTAAASYASEDIIYLLTSKYPQITGAKDIDGRTPLMLACNKPVDCRVPYSHLDEIERIGYDLYEQRAWPPEVIKALIFASPRTVTDEDNSGMTALEYAISSEAPSHVIQILQQASLAECLRRRAESHGKLVQLTDEGNMFASPFGRCGIPFVINVIHDSFLDRMSTVSF